MPEPTLGDVHVDTALTDFSRAYFQRPESYLAGGVFPIVNVAQRSNKYYEYDKNELLRTDAQKRSPGTESAVRSYKLSTADYFCEVYSVAVDVSEQTRANADPTTFPNRLMSVADASVKPSGTGSTTGFS